MTLTNLPGSYLHTSGSTLLSRGGPRRFRTSTSEVSLVTMNMIDKVTVLVLALALEACTTFYQEYPTDLVKDAEPNIEFKVLKAAPSAYQGRVIQLAGEILQIESAGEGTVIWAQRKRLEEDPEYPGYRPVEIGDDPPDQFFLYFKGHLDSQGQRLGNRFIAVAELIVSSGSKDGKRKDLSASEQLSFRARCLHIWKTGHKKISAFPDRYNQVYAPLRQDTYCVTGSQSVRTY